MSLSTFATNSQQEKITVLATVRSHLVQRNAPLPFSNLGAKWGWQPSQFPTHMSRERAVIWLCNEVHPEGPLLCRQRVLWPAPALHVLDLLAGRVVPSGSWWGWVKKTTHGFPGSWEAMPSGHKEHCNKSQMTYGIGDGKGTFRIWDEIHGIEERVGVQGRTHTSIS